MKLIIGENRFMDGVFTAVELTPEQKKLQEEKELRIKKIEEKLNEAIIQSKLPDLGTSLLINAYTEGLDIGNIGCNENLLKLITQLAKHIEHGIDPCDCRFDANEMLLFALALGYGIGRSNSTIEIIDLIQQSDDE